MAILPNIPIYCMPIIYDEISQTPYISHQGVWTPMFESQCIIITRYVLENNPKNCAELRRWVAQWMK